ncbi:MAG: RidA family protein [Gammaproteobacteria bacterium]|nr:RidA family protein [Gammaproteobacteria bacterium]MDE2345363.1 RidA family protein [Gammaproteobacteria bacterium]
MSRTAIHTDLAPKAIGPYSQAIRAGNTVYLSGQIGLDPNTGQLVAGGIQAEARRVFENLKAVAETAGQGLAQVVRLTVYLVDLNDFAKLNEIMSDYFQAPYPARATIGVAALPRNARVEVDAVMMV